MPWPRCRAGGRTVIGVGGNRLPVHIQYAVGNGAITSQYGKGLRYDFLTARIDLTLPIAGRFSRTVSTITTTMLRGKPPTTA